MSAPGSGDRFDRDRAVPRGGPPLVAGRPVGMTVPVVRRLHWYLLLSMAAVASVVMGEGFWISLGIVAAALLLALLLDRLLRVDPPEDPAVDTVADRIRSLVFIGVVVLIPPAWIGAWALAIFATSDLTRSRWWKGTS